MIEILKRNLLEVNQRISDAAQRSGRPSADVQLVAVTKYVDVETTKALIDAGCNVLGENRPQQLWGKAEQLADESVQWHMIGHLQRNKVKRTVAVTSLIHSVDSERLLKAINDSARDQKQIAEVLVEVNVSGESAKDGLSPSRLPELLASASEMTSVTVKGLMCMAGLSSNDDATRKEFDLLRELRDANQHVDGSSVQLKELSMGMSGDFEMAIEHGATIVRVGSALFRGIR